MKIIMAGLGCCALLLLATTVYADEKTAEKFSSPPQESSSSEVSSNSPPVSAGASGMIAKPEDADNDQANQALDVDKKITEGVNLMHEAVTSASGDPSIKWDAPGFQAMSKSAGTYIEHKQACVDRQAWAANVCLEHLSSDLHSGLATINTLLSTVGSMAVNDSCSKFSKAMDVAKAALTAYTSACGVMKAGCGWSCVKARDGLKNLASVMEKSAPRPFICEPLPTSTPEQYERLRVRCENLTKMYINGLSLLQKNVPAELAEKDKKAVAGKAALCTGKYAILLASAGTGILSLANSLKQGKDCDENSDGTAAVAETKVDKCADAEKAANDPECICKANPRTPGCANSYQKANEGSLANLSTGPTGDLTTGATGGALAGSLGSSGMDGLGDLNGSSDSGSGIAGAPMGGGGGGLSGFGGGGGGAGGDRGEAGKKGLNTDILSGAGGGGGGGGFGGYRGAASDSKYRQYLPGGDKDPNKAMAGQQAWTKEVTGQGGKSNFEKVKERYRDNKGTLLNN